MTTTEKIAGVAIIVIAVVGVVVIGMYAKNHVDITSTPTQEETDAFCQLFGFSSPMNMPAMCLKTFLPSIN